MKIRKKPLIMLLCALTVITSAAFGTVAYLTDRDVVTNHFTIGDVAISMDETKVDADGEPVPDPEYDPDDPDHDSPYLRTDDQNEYPLIPGGEYVKDPTVTVAAGSEKSYVRMIVTISNASEIEAIFSQLTEDYPDGFVPGDFVEGRDNSVWVATGGMQKDTAKDLYILEFRYYTPVEPSESEDETLPPLFRKILIPGELTNTHLSQLTDFVIEVYAHAIQTTGFDSADEAWAAFGE